MPASGPATWSWFLAQWAAGPDALGDLLPPPNLAADGAATASSTIAGSRAANAIDGDPATDWNSGTGPPAWIEVDLGRARSIGLMRLRATQFPEGRTDHRLLGRGPGTSNRWVELVRFREATQDGQSLEWQPDEPLTGIRRLRVEMVESPSWVAWRGIEVYAPSR